MNTEAESTGSANQRMNEEPCEKSGWSISVWVFVTIPLLYVLSIGPAGLLVKRSGNNPVTLKQIKQIYAPVIWLHDHTVLKKPLEAYVELWGVK